MNMRNMKLPIIIIAIGMIVAIVSCLLTGILQEPVIKEHDFEYAVTYRLDGEVNTFNGVYKCSFDGYSMYDDPTFRNYVGEYTQNGIALDSHSFTIAHKDGVELYIVTVLDAAYLMGDPDIFDYESWLEDPYLEAVDLNGICVDVSDVFDAEIISWEYPEPVENSFKFVGFSILHAGSMLAMLLVGVFTIIACIIFVKKDTDISYKVVDILSIVFNVIIIFAVVPVITFLIWLLQITMSGEELIFQVYLCFPAMTAFTIAASIILRRKGFAKSGFFVQFIFPVIFMAQLVVESFIYNFFS